MARKSKYTPDRVAVIVSAIEATGFDKDGIKAGGIGHDTFYKWISEFPEFAEKVAKAKDKFRYTCPETLRKKGLEVVAQYMNEGVTDTVTTEEVVKDANGRVKETRFSRKTFKKPPPHWIIDRVLGKNLPLIEAVQVLIQNGAATPQQAMIVEECLAEMSRRLSEVASLTQVQGQLEQMYTKGSLKSAAVDDGR